MVRPFRNGIGHHFHRLACLRLVKTTTHQTLDLKNRVLWIYDGLALGSNTYQTVATLCKRHHRRGRSCTFRVGDYRGVAAFHHSYNAVGGAEVNADNFSHRNYLPPEL